MENLKTFEVWFVTGSQHLYGPETLKLVAADSNIIAASFDSSPMIPVKVIFKPVLTTPDQIYELCSSANNSEKCIGLITWMHTFSPAKMWIRGLNILSKPFLHLHTQLNRDIPWTTIDRIAVWVRAAAAFSDAQSMKVARFGDNMRDVAVTEGNKVSAQLRMGYSVYGYGVGDLVKCPDMPKLPVASILWKPLPDLKNAAAAWIFAGGAHHTGFSSAICSEYIEDFAGMLGIEYLCIGDNFDLASFRNELRWNEVYYHLADGIK